MALIMNLTDGHKTKRENDDTMFGTMVYDYNKKAIAILIKTWDNAFCDEKGVKYYTFATCVDIKGKRYETPIGDITPLETMEQEELEKLGLK